MPLDSKTQEKTKFSEEQLIREAVRRVEGRWSMRIPGPATELSITASPVVLAGQSMVHLRIWFNLPTTNAIGANIWIRNYFNLNETSGKEVFQLVGKADRSPVSLVLIPTGNKVLVGVEPYNQDGVGAGLETMPTQSILLT